MAKGRLSEIMMKGTDAATRDDVRWLAENLARMEETATSVVGYWDSLWAVREDDARPTEFFRDEHEQRIHELRKRLENL